jgi:sulfite reductase (NADPH) flavoprotein alpha-component
MTNPFMSRIKYRRLLNKEGSSKKTYHIILDIKDSDIQYEPGDSVAILPQNDPRIIDLMITYMKAMPTTEIKNPKTKEKMQLYDFLQNKASITKAPPNLLKLFIKKPSIEDIKKHLSSYHAWDLLKKFSRHNIEPQVICDNLLPLLPRLYSATSSLKMYPTELHLIITHVSYELSGIKRNGVCTEFMCHLASVLKTPIPTYIEPSHGFNLTKDKEKPIIMVAAGCGIAPFRAFLEDRFIDNAKGPNWLFFGERNSKTDFYFEDFFKDLVDKNSLRLTTAFSRDQKDKIYVQDKILENKSDIWQWIQKGAIIYVCGNVKIAKGIDENLKEVFIEEGNYTPQEANVFLKTLIKEKRYLKDVY